MLPHAGRICLAQNDRGLTNLGNFEGKLQLIMYIVKAELIIRGLGQGTNARPGSIGPLQPKGTKRGNVRVQERMSREENKGGQFPKSKIVA